MIHRAKKLLSLLLICCILQQVLPMGAIVLAGGVEEQDWTGYTPISTKEDLDAIRNNLSGKYYLTNDIIFSEEDFAEGGNFYNSGAGWEPIGMVSVSAFTGIFDGNGHIVSGLYIDINSLSAVYTGLFGYNKGTIHNLGIRESSITVSSKGENIYVGGITGVNDGGEISSCSNSNGRERL
ncbi:MAG TPA: hypothetical protein VFD52_03845 [Clostridia bacterium]|nr:hypothetical protein [Clostridia bacterium]